jgi:hypothetical membrane protein
MPPGASEARSGFSPPTARILLLAGLVPLPWFLAFATAAGLVKPGYRAASQHVSELTAEPGLAGTLANVASLGSGLAFVLFGVGLWLHTRRRLSIGSVCWIVFGLSRISNGLWAMGTPLHGLYAAGIVALVAPALSLLGLRDLRDGRVSFGMTVMVSLCGVAYLWLNLTGADPEGYRGLTQRIFSSINSLWPAAIVLSLRPWRRRAHTPSPG